MMRLDNVLNENDALNDNEPVAHVPDARVAPDTFTAPDTSVGLDNPSAVAGEGDSPQPAAPSHRSEQALMPGQTDPEEPAGPKRAASPVAPFFLSHDAEPHSTSRASPSRTTQAGRLWADLPVTNRVFALSGSLCLLLVALRLTLPPLVATAASAGHPYTAAGRSENCLANLAVLHQALGMYAADNDDLYPPLDYTKPAPKGGEGERVTWVALVQDRAGTSHLQCPSGPGIDRRSPVSSYALNPVLSLASVKDVDDAGQTLLLADAGTKHDLSLLPPYPSWPSFANRAAPPADEASGTLSNLALRHNGSAGAVYVDGHAALLGGGDAEQSPTLWGGSAVFRGAVARLAARSETANALVWNLKAGEIDTAAGLLRSHGKELTPVTDGLVALCRLNEGEEASESVTTAGWNLAAAAKAAGDDSITKQLNEEESRRCQSVLEQTKNGGWETKTTSWGSSIKIPSAWTMEEEIEGHYKRAYLRSSLKKEVFVLIETGEHRSYVTPRLIDWHGMEADLRSRSRTNGYKRIAMKGGMLNGQSAGMWEFEIEKAGSPRLRKRYLGYTDGWNSHVIAYVAPARDFASWQPVFERIQ